MTVETFLSEGFAFQKLGKYKEALESYDKAIEEDQYSAPAFYARGFILEELGRYEEAIESYNQAIALHSGFYQAYNNKGSALIDLGMYQQAIICFDTVLSIKPDFPQAYNNKGFALQCLERSQEAIACYDKAIELKQDDPQAHYNKGMALKNLGNYKEAIVSLETAKSLKSDPALCLCDIACCNLSLGNDKEALEGFKAALSSIESSSKLKDIKEEDIQGVRGALIKIIGLEEAILKETKDENLSELKEERRRVILGINFQKVFDTQELDRLMERFPQEYQKITEQKMTESGFNVRNWPQNEEEVVIRGESEETQEAKSRVRKVMSSVDDDKDAATEGDEQKPVALEFQNKNNHECCTIF